MPDNKDKIDKISNDIDEKIYGIDSDSLLKKDTAKVQNVIKNLNGSKDGSTAPISTVDLITRIMDEDEKKKPKNTNPVKNKKIIEDLVSKENLGRLLGFEKDRFSRYNDYYEIYSYIPQIADCIDIYRDTIMSPDDLTKDSVNVMYKGTLEVSNKNENVIENIGRLKNKYKLNTLFKERLLESLIYGDQFVAVLQYDKEFNRMMLKEDIIVNKEIISKDIEIDENVKFITESIIAQNKESKTQNSPKEFEIYKDIQKSATEILNKNVKYDEDTRRSLLDIDDKTLAQLNRKRAKKNELESKDSKYTNFNINGSIIRNLKPDKTIKLEVDGVNFGYIYIEKDSADDNPNGAYVGPVNDFFDARVDIEKSKFRDREEVIANIFVKGISKKIDNNVVLKNKDFKEYIYMLLKDRYITEKPVKITYLAPEEVVHFTPEKDNIYGRSRLSRSLFHSKLYIATLINELMQKITKGREKRIVYVETGIDNDTEGTIQEVVKDFKSKELPTDMLKSMTSIFRNIGANQDLFIPLFDGEKMVDFDVLSGINSDVDKEFLEFLLKSAISGTGIPANFVDASQEVEFSRSLAMQNSTFVRKIVSDQHTFAESCSELIRILYYNEFMVNNNTKEENELVSNRSKNEDYIDLNDISVSFPPPLTLNINNINDQISNASQMIDFITSNYISEDETDSRIKRDFRKNVSKEILANIDWDKMDQLYTNTITGINEENLKEPKDNDQADSGLDDQGF
ncbi:portal vertex protein [Bacillus phage vB_BpuM-BpSp]|nr:portal vertex protein [Bacillus phage vB_BpuM-BpSp]